MLSHPLARNPPSSSTSGEGSTSNTGSGNGNSNVGIMGNNGIVQGDNGDGFEFTKRKKWPQLLLTELVGSAVFCLVPTISNGGYKIIYTSPATADMIGYKADELEGRDMTELLYAVDKQPFTSLLTQMATASPRGSNSRDLSASTSDSSSPDAASSPSQAGVPRGESVNAFFRLVGRDSVPRVWEFRAHGYFGDQQPSNTINSPEPNGGFDGGGIMGSAMGQPQIQQQSDPAAIKAIWLMGRKAGSATREEDANGNPLDAFLDLKLENERLREELRELQVEMSDDEDQGIRRRGNVSKPQSPRQNDSYISLYPPAQNESSSASDSESDGNVSGSSAGGNDAYQSKALFASSSSLPGSAPRGTKRKTESKPKKSRPPKPIFGMMSSGPPAKLEEGMHVCVTCGRTDSPEWRKGPLGPKTLCNACGLRWAKRNSTAPTRRERKPAGETKKAQAAAAAAAAAAQAQAAAQLHVQAQQNQSHSHSQYHGHHGHIHGHGHGHQ